MEPTNKEVDAKEPHPPTFLRKNNVVPMLVTNDELIEAILALGDEELE